MSPVRPSHSGKPFRIEELGVGLSVEQSARPVGSRQDKLEEPLKQQSPETDIR